MIKMCSKFIMNHGVRRMALFQIFQKKKFEIRQWSKRKLLPSSKMR